MVAPAGDDVGDIGVVDISDDQQSDKWKQKREQLSLVLVVYSDRSTQLLPLHFLTVHSEKTKWRNQLQTLPLCSFHSQLIGAIFCLIVGWLLTRA